MGDKHLNERGLHSFGVDMVEKELEHRRCLDHQTRPHHLPIVRHEEGRSSRSTELASGAPLLTGWYVDTRTKGRVAANHSDRYADVDSGCH